MDKKDAQGHQRAAVPLRNSFAPLRPSEGSSTDRCYGVSEYEEVDVGTRKRGKMMGRSTGGSNRDLIISNDKKRQGRFKRGRGKRKHPRNR